MRLRQRNTAPTGGFCFKDKATGFTVHSWSLREAAAQWYNQQLKRGINSSIDQCTKEVEKFTCEELMKSGNWQEWVDVTPPAQIVISPPINLSTECNVSVIIPAYNPGDRLNKVINCILDQVNEVIVVDSPLVSIPRHKSSKVKNLTIGFPDKESGFSKKCNAGASVAKSEYLWFLNDDCYPNPDCVSKLMAILLSNQKIGAVGHLLRYPDGKIQHGGTKRSPNNVGFPHIEDNSITMPTEMEAVTAASMLVRKEAFNNVGGFDESYFLYLEDSDLCLKLRTAGWKIYYTPYAEAIHETNTSSKTRTDLSDIVKDSVAKFTAKWDTYFSQPPPQFDSYQKTANILKIDVVYVHLVGHPGYEGAAKRFVESALKFPPGQEVNWIIACNSDSGNQLSPEMTSVFQRLGNITFFKHDNSGWDIGAFQAYTKTSTADFCLYLGGTAYCRRPNWIFHMVNAFRTCGDGAIYGVCGNLGDQRVNVSPHIRTTGFWCAPSVMNRYPTIVRVGEQRYPFEHGPSGLTMWAWSQGLQVLVVDADGIWQFPNWNDGPNGFHRGNQSSLLLGDRLTEPPYYAHA